MSDQLGRSPVVGLTWLGDGTSMGVASGGGTMLSAATASGCSEGGRADVPRKRRMKVARSLAPKRSPEA
jgi:hypothetical protein